MTSSLLTTVDTGQRPPTDAEILWKAAPTDAGTVEDARRIGEDLWGPLPEGAVDRIVNVTGVRDLVGDTPVPGCYARTIATRVPKIARDHDRSRRVGKVLAATELLPGDPRLPKRRRNGQPWPREAGAYVIRAQFMLGTQAGKDAYAEELFYGPEAEWSIGYTLPPGGSQPDGKGGRLLLDIDVWENSQVMWGASEDTGSWGGWDTRFQAMTAAGVKDAFGHGVDREVRALHAAALAGVVPIPEQWEGERDGKAAERTCRFCDRKATVVAARGDADTIAACDRHKALARMAVRRAGGTGKVTLKPLSEEKQAPDMPASEAARGRAVEVALFPPLDVAERVAVDGGVPPEDLRLTLAVLGDLTEGDVLQTAGPTYTLKRAQAALDAATGERTPVDGVLQGLVQWDSGDQGMLAGAAVNAPGLDALRVAVVDALRADGAPVPAEGFLPHLPLAYGVTDVEPLPRTGVVFDHLSLVWGERRFDLPLDGPEAQPLPDEQEGSPEPATNVPEERLADEPVAPLEAGEGKAAITLVTRDTLPTDGWESYRYDRLIRMRRMSGRFTVETRYGPLTVEDGWVMVDAEGWPLPVSADVQSRDYRPADENVPRDLARENAQGLPGGH